MMEPLILKQVYGQDLFFGSSHANNLSIFCIRAYATELGVWAEIQWHALMQVTSACCIVHANGGGAVLILCNLHW